MSTTFRFQDPIGEAILDFHTSGIDSDIIVASDSCEDDVIPASYLFRSFLEMPEIEQTALQRCAGHVLDIGAGSGTHAQYLRKKGHRVECIDTSPGAVKYMLNQGISARNENFFELRHETYDTLLFMMNGIGISGTLENLERTLQQAKSLLKPGGKILCDSTDIEYLYMNDDGSKWVNLHAAYYGDFRFKMRYKAHESPWFDWLYVDFDNLKKAAENVGMKSSKVMENEYHYLAELTY